jgi:Bacterial Ig-like domain (group 1)
MSSSRVQDATGLPAKTVSNTTVLLSSSDTRVLALPQSSVTIPSGSTFAFANFTTNFVPGTSFITASDTGFISGSASVSVVGASPFALKLYAQPDKMVTCSSPDVTSCSGRVVASLVDESGRPARAPANISLALRSSNESVITVPDNATIAAGSVYTVFQYQATSINGSAVITGSFPGLISDFATIRTNPTNSTSIGVTPFSLEISAGPNPLPADGQSYYAVAVSLLDKHGNAIVVAAPTAVKLTSSSSGIGNVTDTIVIPAGTNTGNATFTSTFLPGITQLTASATDFLPSQTPLATYGPIPAKVVVSGLPSTLVADGGRYNNLQVMLEDSAGLPAIAPVDMVVQLSSSSTAVASVNDLVTIKAGRTSALATVATSVLAGSANITASAFGPANTTGVSLLSSFTVENTIIPVPSKLALYVSPATTILAGKQNGFILAVQLQDDKGNPALAREPVRAVINPSNGSVLSKSIALTIPIGADYAISTFQPNNLGASSLIASAPGLGSSSAKVDVVSSPIVAAIAPSGATIHTDQTATLTVTLSLFGHSLEGANVSWSSSAGKLGAATTTTNAAGQASVQFTPSAPGTSKISGLA